MDEAINQHTLYLELIQDSDQNYPHMATDFKILGNYGNIPKCELLETCDEIYVMESLTYKRWRSILLTDWFRKNNL